MSKSTSPLKTKILDSIKHVRSFGYTLVCDSWGSSTEKCACALGCVLLTDDPQAVILGNQETIEDLVGLLEVSEDWLDSFLDGFDGNGEAIHAKDAGGWKMGTAIRKETTPVSYLMMENTDGR